jgi:hypothetical protein
MLCVLRGKESKKTKAKKVPYICSLDDFATSMYKIIDPWIGEVQINAFILFEVRMGNLS